jgi:hypothetical protein
MKIVNVPDGLLRALILLFTKPLRFWSLMRWQPDILWKMITGEMDVHIYDEKTRQDRRVR